MDPTSTPPRMAGWLEQAWLTRYLDRELSEEERAWFEAYVLDKGDLLDVIEADTHLMESIEGGIDSKVFTSIAEEVGPPASLPSRLPVPTKIPPTRRRLSIVAPFLAAAASFVVVVSALIVRTPDRMQSSVGDPLTITLDANRGDASAPRIEHSQSSAAIAIVQIAVPPSARGIHVETADGVIDLSPDADGFVTVLVKRRDLPTIWTLKYASTSDKQSNILLSVPAGIVGTPKKEN